MAVLLWIKRGCAFAIVGEDTKRGKKKEEINACAFCRRPAATDEENIERIKSLMENCNATAFDVQAGHYANGSHGLQQDWAKANELWLKAGELGCAEAYSKLGYSYHVGRDTEVDKKKAKHYYEIAAMKGDVYARHNLGALEGKAGNHERADKHYVIAAKAGYRTSLDVVKEGFTNGFVTKEEYESTLRAYYERQVT